MITEHQNCTCNNSNYEDIPGNTPGPASEFLSNILYIIAFACVGLIVYLKVCPPNLISDSNPGSQEDLTDLNVIGIDKTHADVPH